MDYPPSKVEIVRQKVKVYPDFPKPTIIFRDIFGVFADAAASKALYDLLVFHSNKLGSKLEAVCGIETRGFLFGPVLALHLQIPFVPIRKKGKLPGGVASVSYNLEYGSGTLEIQKNALTPNSKVLLVDDLLATGGSLTAACELIHSIGSEVDHCLVIMEIEDLKGRVKVPSKVYSFIKI